MTGFYQKFADNLGPEKALLFLDQRLMIFAKAFRTLIIPQNAPEDTRRKRPL